jgi:hypothetical protein
VEARIAELISIGGDPIGEQIRGAEWLSNWGSLGRELAAVLERKNGFYAYESALLVRPLERDHSPRGIMEWNSPQLWKDEYRENLRHVLFFAEDLFGCQFCIHGGFVYAFDPETAAFEPMGSSLDSWAGKLMGEAEVLTGFPLAHAWQKANGPLNSGFRLVPVLPFVCNGQFDFDNLRPIEEVEGMSFRALVSNGIAELPDGAAIKFVVGDTPRGSP